MISETGLLDTVASEHPRRLLFATISGAHLYGFPSPDSDFDLRGVHLASAEDLFALDDCNDTIERSEIREGREIDLVTHDARKFFRLMLKRNGYVLEQLFSPLIVRTGPEHEELIELGRACITRHHAHHYLGFAENQWKLLMKDSPPRIKPLLYVYRVLLTGIQLMRTGEIEADLRRLNESFRMGYLDELIAAKTQTEEQHRLPSTDIAFHESEYRRLLAELEEAGRASTLPETPTARDGLNDLLLRLRMRTVGAFEPGTRDTPTRQ